jgi:hypothetical protein
MDGTLQALQSCACIVGTSIQRFAIVKSSEKTLLCVMLLLHFGVFNNGVEEHVVQRSPPRTRFSKN